MLKRKITTRKTLFSFPQKSLLVKETFSIFSINHGKPLVIKSLESGYFKLKQKLQYNRGKRFLNEKIS